MYHKELCRALWELPVEHWQVDAAVSGNPELSVAGTTLALLSESRVSVGGVAFELHGIGSLRDRIIEHWVDDCLPALARLLKTKCHGG
jgi:hypothetical protein